MSDPFIGEIRIFAGVFAPVGWAFCAGQSVKIADYETLYSLIGITYGGDGVNTFGLPDLRGRVPVCQGQGAGLSARTIGEKGGTSQVQLTSANMPAHNHSFSVSGNQGSTNTPAKDAVLAAPKAQPNGIMYPYVAPTAASVVVQNFNSAAITTAQGGGQPHNNIMPYMAINYIICVTDGIYPQRP